ncbi:hypothetical protein C8J56DRAFT_1013636 [Mycena floridula]|nr:hypothetical protein C8J56DRAFT_1013636 [Mycena floridula]
MELPSSSQLELETLLRHRDAQIAELGDEVTRLRQHLSSQSGPSTADPVTLPPALVSLLLPHLNAAFSPELGAVAGSSSVTAALTQRVQLLQEENDELYDILKRGETGKLKEEVRGLRRVVKRLEGALKESHSAITSLSTELDKSYDTFMSSARQNNNVKSSSRSPRTSYHPMSNSAGNGSSSKHPPTGPRAFKKPRVSESHTSPSMRSEASLSPHKVHNHSNSSSSRFNDARDPSPRLSSDGRGSKSNHNTRMDVDDDNRARPRSVERRRDKDQGGAREDRERDRDGSKSRRNGNFSGGGRGARRSEHRNNAAPMAPNAGPPPNSFGPGGDRTLAERMGL